jgi:transposase
MLPAGDVFRAKLILALASGKSYSEVERKLQTSRPTIARWKQRFEERRIAGLKPLHRGTRPRVATASAQARVVRKLMQQKPADCSTHWSVRKLAGEVGISRATVHRILMRLRLKPHRLERYVASDDPDFERKAADIIGLYLQPPQHAAVFCVDEKTAIQALDRDDPVLPLSPGRAERHGFEYYRHGTALCRAQHQERQGRRKNRPAPHECGVCLLSRGTREESTLGKGDSHCPRQPLGPQDTACRAVSRAQSEG